jgi:hypothetical protein
LGLLSHLGGRRRNNAGMNERLAAASAGIVGHSSSLSISLMLALRQWPIAKPH